MKRSISCHFSRIRVSLPSQPLHRIPIGGNRPSFQAMPASNRRSMGFWGRIMTAVNTMDGRKLIGEDAAGNRYWEIPAPDQYPNPRREVEYKAKGMEDINFESVPSEWRLWFRYMRDDAPTPEEIAESQAKASATLALARELEAQDKKHRQDQMAHGKLSKQSSGGSVSIPGSEAIAKQVKKLEQAANASMDVDGGVQGGSDNASLPGAWDPNEPDKDDNESGSARTR